MLSRIAAGDAAFESHSDPISVDVIGWAFTWLERPEGDGTSMTERTATWDGDAYPITLIAESLADQGQSKRTAILSATSAPIDWNEGGVGVYKRGGRPWDALVRSKSPDCVAPAGKSPRDATYCGTVAIVKRGSDAIGIISEHDL